MRNAAMVLGVIGGVIGMFVGFVGYGWTEIAGWAADVTNGLSDRTIGEIEDPDRIRAMSLLAPILAIAGGAMAPRHAGLGGAMTSGSAVGMYWAFGFGVFTMFPIAMCAVAGVLGLASAVGGGD